MFKRDIYGALFLSGSDSSAAQDSLKSARALVDAAASTQKIPASFDDMRWERINSRVGNKRVGEALHHEIYDLNDCAVLVCCRAVEGNRYGVKTVSKTYFVVRRHGRGVRVKEAPKSIAAKAAKSAGTELGLAIAICEGKAKLMPPGGERIGYKLVARTADGGLISVFDGSPWAIGKRRGEAATPDHTGGFYYYRNPEQAIEAAKAGTVFPADLVAEKSLALVKVVASGNEYKLSNNKLCATYLTPLEVVGNFEPPAWFQAV